MITDDQFEKAWAEIAPVAAIVGVSRNCFEDYYYASVLPPAEEIGRRMTEVMGGRLDG